MLLILIYIINRDEWRPARLGYFRNASTKNQKSVRLVKFKTVGHSTYKPSDQLSAIFIDDSEFRIKTLKKKIRRW